MTKSATLRRSSRVRGLATVAVFLVACLAPAAFAQPADEPDMGDPEANQPLVGLPFHVSDHGTAGAPLANFHRRAKREQWPQAVSHLQTLLDLDPEKGLVVRVPDAAPVRYVGANAHARELFEALPQAGRTAWEELSRERAEALLARGIRLRRIEDLKASAARFPARDIRRRAYSALSRLAFGRGEFQTAGYHLEQLLRVADETEHAGIYAQIAFARAQAGEREGVERVTQLTEHLKDTLVPGPDGAEPLAQFLERMLAASGPAPRNARSWPMFGGNRHGAGVSETPDDPGPDTRHWQTTTGFEEGRENGRSPASNPGYRPVVPVIAGGTAYINNGLTLQAMDVASGTVRWQYDSPCRVRDWRDTAPGLYGVTVHDGVVYAPIAVRYDRTLPDSFFFNRRIAYNRVHRVLHAFDARTGDLLWSHGDEYVEDRPDRDEMRDQSIACLPLVVGDDVYATTWQHDGSFQVRLACFDRRTGATRWRRLIVSGQQELNLFGRPVKELATSSISERDGRLYFATCLGVAAAVERTAGEILWLSAYPQLPATKSWAWYQTADRAVTWWPSPVTARRDVILMAPTDSRYLMALDPETGKQLWRQSCEQNPARYRWYLGVAEDRAYVLGTRLQCFDVKTGAAMWKGDEGRLLAQRRWRDAKYRGLLTGDRVYVPVDGQAPRTGAIIAIDAKVGGSVAEFAIERPGELVSGDGTLLVVSGVDTPEFVDAYFDIEGARDRLLQRVRERPDDPRLRLEAGELLRRRGELDEAIASLEQGLRLTDNLAARARDRVERPIRRALFESYVERARLRVGAAGLKGLEDLERAVDVTRNPEDAVSGLFLLQRLAADRGQQKQSDTALRRVIAEFGEVRVAVGGGARAPAGVVARYALGEMAARAGRPSEAVSAWIDLLEQYPSVDLGESSVREVVRAAVEDLRVEHPNQVTSVVRERATRAFDTAKGERDVEGLARVASLYPDREIAAEAAALAADWHLEANEPRAAVGVLKEMLRRPLDDRRSATALWRLSHAYRQLGAVAQERRALKTLDERFGGELLEAGKSASDVARETLGEERFRTPARRLPALRPPLDLWWHRPSSSQLVPMVLEIEGNTPASLATRLLIIDGKRLEVREQRDGTEVWRLDLPFSLRTVAGTHDALVLVGAAQQTNASYEDAVVVSGRSAVTGAENWSRTLDGAYEGAGEHLGVLFVLRSAQNERGREIQKLAAVDLGSGEVIADREFEGRLRPTLTVAETGLILEQIPRYRGRDPRVIVTLDATDLATRGRAELHGAMDASPVPIPGGSQVACVDASRTIAVINSDTGRIVKRLELAQDNRPRRVKSIVGVEGGIVVSDTGGQVRRLDIATGKELWRAVPINGGSLTVAGEAADGDLVVVSASGSGPDKRRMAAAVAYDANTGQERWRTELPQAGARFLPTICDGVIVYEITEWIETSRTYRWSVLILDRNDGRVLQDLRHPTVSSKHQIVRLRDGMIVLASSGGIAVYGSDAK